MDEPIKVRDRECMQCGEKWVSPVRMSRYVPGFEHNEGCWNCHGNAVIFGPVRDGKLVPDRS